MFFNQTAGHLTPMKLGSAAPGPVPRRVAGPAAAHEDLDLKTDQCGRIFPYRWERQEGGEPMIADKQVARMPKLKQKQEAGISLGEPEGENLRDNLRPGG